MPSRRHPHITGSSPTPYRSTACRTGTHTICAESCPDPMPTDIPVVWERCDCPCHSTVGLTTPVEVTR
ncbi:hypothetical protein B9W62_25280 [Streptomyces sp. CS113]|nr:hypothetical protein B9W62_25280 [Streptomyces sp. CS113]